MIKLSNSLSMVEVLDPEKLLTILNYAKIPKTEYIIIPRIIYQKELETCILGVNNNSIINVNSYTDLNKEITPLVLWSDSSLSHIAISTNQLNPMVRAIKEEVNNIGNISLYYNKYLVNGQYVSIANNISAQNPINIKNSQGTISWIPQLLLSNHTDFLPLIKYMISLWENSMFVFRTSLKDDEAFNNIWEMKSSDGTKAWIPNIEKYGEKIKNYVMYLSKIMFNVSKSDMIEIEIRNNIPNENFNRFLVKFTVIKSKGKEVLSIHEYYNMGIVIV